MKKMILIGLVLLWGLLLVSGKVSQTHAQPRSATQNYGTVKLKVKGGAVGGHFPEVWDLTAGDLEISFVYDATGLKDKYNADVAHAVAQLGVRTYGYGDFNPTSGDEGAGVWLVTDYHDEAGTFGPDAPKPILDLDDKLMLQKAGGHGEGDYNLPSSPGKPHRNHRFWFDRDGVAKREARNLKPSVVDGGTYNTEGKYKVVIRLHATSATSGEAFMTVNGLDQGFETNGDWGSVELSPAGMTFTGDMTKMQVFYGFYSYGKSPLKQRVVFRNIRVKHRTGR
jgi:hypothetical protein